MYQKNPNEKYLTSVSNLVVGILCFLYAKLLRLIYSEKSNYYAFPKDYTFWSTTINSLFPKKNSSETFYLFLFFFLISSCILFFISDVVMLFFIIMFIIFFIIILLYAPLFLDHINRVIIENYSILKYKRYFTFDDIISLGHETQEILYENKNRLNIINTFVAAVFVAFTCYNVISELAPIVEEVHRSHSFESALPQIKTPIKSLNWWESLIYAYNKNKIYFRKALSN